MSQDTRLYDVYQTEWDALKIFRNKSPVQIENDLKNTTLYPFYNDHTNTVPQDNIYPLVQHAVDAKQSKRSKKIYIQELEIALQKQIDQTNYFRNTLQKTFDENRMLQKTYNQEQKERVELQKDVENLNIALQKALKEKNLKHSKMNEMIRMNEELSRENALHNSAKRMKELSDENKHTPYRR